METLRVGLGSRAYPIYVGAGVLDDGRLYAPHVAGRRTAVITNAVVAPLYLERLARTLAAAGAQASSIVLPDGEQTKDWASLARIFDWLLEEGFGRDAIVVALGGGVIGDLAGFAAATYQRGVPFLQIPTTLLAQVDSSVGGKTGINHPRGKNMIGAFHQPLAVISDIGVLHTLPERELRAGLAEVIKHGFALDAEFALWLETHLERLLQRDEAALMHAVCRSCELKAAIVAQDERESGPRALLNFGHTFGHAIEAAQGYGVWLHGEAVAAGMAIAAALSVRLGLLEQGEAMRLTAILRRAGLPVANSRIAPECLLELMRSDKKTERGRLRFVLLSATGKAQVVADANEDQVIAAITACTSA
ncbi:MAG: 3-dehydroquinate synthase [Betaproteobacteria bacterium]|nr:MAG: 3-dehydroquinate synthase [Betaproteobacteria bacterium]